MRLPSNILVAEDDPLDFFLLQRAFVKAGRTRPLCFVRDGFQAVDYLLGQPPFNARDSHPFPDLLLLDLKMPCMPGLEFLSWLRSQPGLRRLPVVVLTSSDLRRDINSAYDLGVNSYLVKPLDGYGDTSLIQTLERYWLQVNLAPDCQPPEPA